MAALYLHNALFNPAASAQSSATPTPDPYTPHHDRHRSSQSSVTVVPSFRTSNSEFSHPTEPLLNPEYSGSYAYADLLSRQPTHPSGPTPGWDMGLTLVGDQPTMRERKDFWEKAVKKRLRRLKVTKSALEMLLGAWAMYNTVRYFVAFAFYRSRTAQAIALILGASTTLTIGLHLASALIASFSSHLISTRISHKTLHTARETLRYLASFFVLAPAVVSFALVFVLRDAQDPDLHFLGRCHWDIDVVWSASRSKCGSAAPAWGAWLAAAIVRLIVTPLVIVVYHLTSRAYAHIRRPSQLGHARSRRQSGYDPSYSVTEPSALSPTFQTMMNAKQSNSPVSLKLTQHPSSSTLVEHGRSRKGSGADRKSIRSTRSRTGSLPNSSSNGHSSEADVATLNEGGKLSASPPSSTGTPVSSTHEIGGQDTDMFGFVDRFKSLVNQVSREIDDGLDVVRRDSTENSPPSSYHDPHATTQGLSSEAIDRLGNIYDEFGGRAEIPDEHVRVLGGYIRRMPTIESLGSREMGSMTSSIHREVFLGSVHTNSHPPTRTNTLGESAPSRSSSMASSAATGGHGPASAQGGSSSVGHSGGSGDTGGTNGSSYHSAVSISGEPMVDSPVPDSRSVRSPSPVVFLNSNRSSGEPMDTSNSVTFPPS